MRRIGCGNEKLGSLAPKVVEDHTAAQRLFLRVQRVRRVWSDASDRLRK